MGISRTNLVFGLLLMVVAFAILEYGHLLRVYTKSVSFLLLDDAEEISYAFTQPSLSSLPSSSSSSTASRKEENHHHVGGHTISGALEEQQHDEQQPAAESRLRSGPTDNVQQVASTITIPSSQAGAKSPASTETSVGSSIATSGIKHETKEVAAATSIQTHRHQQKLKFDRIYYINLPNAKQRKEFTESWLSLQSNFTGIPYQRVEAQRGIPGSTCVTEKNISASRCIGISGLSQTVINIIDNYNTSGLTFIMEDDYLIYNFSRLEESVSLVEKIDPNWDVIRWDCNGDIPSSFTWIYEKSNLPVVRANAYKPNSTQLIKCQETKRKVCWMCGGTYAMLWNGRRKHGRDANSLDKLKHIWNQRPYQDIDCRLVHSPNINGYCIQLNAGQFHHPTGEESSIPNPNKTTTTTTVATASSTISSPDEWVKQQFEESTKLLKQRDQAQPQQIPLVDQVYYLHGPKTRHLAHKQAALLLDDNINSTSAQLASPLPTVSTSKHNKTIPLFYPIPLAKGTPAGGCIEQTKDSLCTENIAVTQALVSNIIEQNVTAGLTLIIRHSYLVTNMTLLQESIKQVPNDWDVIRWDCQSNNIPSNFVYINDNIFRSSEYLPGSTIFNNTRIPCSWDSAAPIINSSNNEETSSSTCWYCGGSHIMLWKGTSTTKLRSLWDNHFMDIDCKLVQAPHINSYCIQNLDVGQFQKSKN